YTKSLGDNKRWQIKPEKDWVWSEVEPIVSEELWNQCNLILTERKNGKTPSRRPIHLFTNIAYCHCGQKMYVPSNSPKYVCYKCRNKIPVVDLEGVFHEQLKRFVFSPDEIAKHLAEADHTIKDKQDLLETLHRERENVHHEMDRVYQAYVR